MEKEAKERWHAGIREIDHRGDYLIPILRYEFVEDGKVASKIDVVSSLSIVMLFNHDGSAEIFTLDSISHFLETIKRELRREIPPGMEEAIKIMAETKKKGRIVDVESAKETFGEIRSEWEKLILS